MKRLKWVATCVAAGVWAWSAASAQTTQWFKAESDHFTLYSAVDEATTRNSLKQLETFRTLSNMLLGAADTQAQPKFTVYLIKQNDIATLRPDMSKNIAGIYMECAEGAVAYGEDANLTLDNIDGEDESRIILFHEYSHYVMFHHARTYYPEWYVEGFAEFMSTADPGKDGVSLGVSSRMRTDTLTEAPWISFEKVLDPDFGFAGDKGNDQFEIDRFYAQSWLLTHYMLSDPTRAKALNAYIDRIGKGEAPVAAWDAATGIPVATLDRVLHGYLQHMFYIQVPVPAYPDTGVKIAPLAPELSAFALDQSLLRTCPAAPQGQAILARLNGLKATSGDSLDFKLTLARANLLYGKVEDAEAIVAGLIDAHADSFEANYLMGRVYLKESETAATPKDRNDLVDAARGFFLAAYQIDKLDAPNLYYLAHSFSDKPGYPDQNTLVAANDAHTLAPGVDEYAAFAVFADLAHGKRDEAAQALLPMASNPHDLANAERARKAIEAIKAGKPTQEVLNLLREAKPPAPAK